MEQSNIPVSGIVDPNRAVRQVKASAEVIQNIYKYVTLTLKSKSFFSRTNDDAADECAVEDTHRKHRMRGEEPLVCINGYEQQSSRNKHGNQGHFRLRLDAVASEALAKY